MRSAQITIKDIAKKLGISPSTVSRALKDHPDISPKTKKRVNELAKTLRYKPNAIALSLRNSKSNILGLIIPEVVHYFFSSVISGIEEVASKAGYNIILFQTNESYENEMQGTHALLSARVDGVLASISKTTLEYEHFRNLQENGIPLVLFDRIAEHLDVDNITVDDHAGAFEATEHLIRIGCKRIAHLSAPQHLLIGKNRQQGYIDALKKHHLPIDDSLILKCDTHLEALEKVKFLMQYKNPPDGIFAVNDSTAIGALITAKKMGFNVPDDVAIVGFGDGEIATFTEPTLTTVEQPGFEMGKIAAQMLLDKLLNDKTQETVSKVLKTKLIIRDSTRGK